MWHKLHMEESSDGELDAEIRCCRPGPPPPVVAKYTHRSSVLSSAAKELEFAVHGMSSSQAGYVIRSTSAIKSVTHLAREDSAWGTAADQGREGVREGKGGEWGVVEILRRASLRAKEGSC